MLRHEEGATGAVRDIGIGGPDKGDLGVFWSKQEVIALSAWGCIYPVDIDFRACQDGIVACVIYLIGEGKLANGRNPGIGQTRLRRGIW
jgi:hypothetical protein